MGKMTAESMWRVLRDSYSDATLFKARQALESPRHQPVQDPEHPLVWLVQGSSGSVYRVQLIADAPDLASPLPDHPDDADPLEPGEGLTWVTCTCPNGQARGGQSNCYHGAMVLLRILELDDAKTGGRS